MILSDEEYTTVEQLAGIGYSLKQVALYLEEDEREIEEAYYAPNSLLYYHYQRGLLLAKTAEDMKLQESAAKGNLTAKQLMDKKREAIEFEENKKRILYGE